ncbi:MAG TPA: prephenate dehydrogenase/arogenate dehydrogenase family protein, partial [Anaerolineales bacterium]|nr:prephenate dehydrogenase/arogenate dehydrogenase family protein [Anaerolineales bacterium]
GAVDDVKYNLPASVRGSKIVVLALPFAGIRESLEAIAPDLEEGSLVLDTAPSKAMVTAWAGELLPQGRHYIGLSPAINPEYLHGVEYGVRAARADLFDKGLMVVTTPTGTPGNVFNIGMEFVNLIGAMPLLMDTAEADGIFAAIHLLPQLAASALLDATVDTPGWQEARKLAGRPYASVTSGLAFHDDAQSLSGSVMDNRENVVRLLNTYITSLLKLRDEIEENDREAILDQLENNWRGRIRWDEERHAAEWLSREGQPVSAPSFGDRMNQMLFGSIFTPRKPRKDDS